MVLPRISGGLHPASRLGEHGKRIMRQSDHIMIHVLIAGCLHPSSPGSPLWLLGLILSGWRLRAGPGGNDRHVVLVSGSRQAIHRHISVGGVAAGGCHLAPLDRNASGGSCSGWAWEGFSTVEER